MPLRARSINFACTNNQIDLIKSAGFTKATSILAVGAALWGEMACAGRLMSMPAAWWREDAIPAELPLGPTVAHYYQLEQAQ